MRRNIFQFVRQSNRFP